MLCTIGGEPDVHSPSPCFVVLQSVIAALIVGLAPLSVGIWWVAFLVVNVVVSCNGRRRGVLEELGRSL